VTDFIKTLQEASGKDLLKWQKVWLQSSGVNTIRAEWSCADDGKLKSLKLIQAVPEVGDKILREHRTEVALFGIKNGKLKPIQSFVVPYSDASTAIADAVGAPCPVLIYPNYNDYDYAKVELDPVSLKTAEVSLTKIEDPFVRQMLWHTLWEMVTDGKIRAQDYAETVLSQTDRETDTQVLGKTLSTLVNPDPEYDSVLKFVTGKTRDSWAERIEKFNRDHLLKAPPGSDVQLVWYRAFLDSVYTDGGLQFARALLEEKTKLKGFKMDQEHRWEVIETLARGGVSDAQGLIDRELKADNTDIGQKSAIAAGVSIPTLENKKLWLDKILNPSLPFAKLRVAMNAFYILGQEELSRIAVAPYFEKLPSLAKSSDGTYMRRFTSWMYPRLCDPSIIAQTTAILGAHSDFPTTMIKPLKVGRQEEERCIRAREKAGR
jgi:aminopeptidase N